MSSQLPIRRVQSKWQIEVVPFAEPRWRSVRRCGARAKGLRLLATCLVLAAALAGLGTAAAAPAQKLPRFVRLHLAGGRLEDEATYVRYDPAERYYLVAQNDCDGASVDLVLTPDTLLMGFQPTDVKRVTLPRLRSGTGVNIGDTPAQVRRKLGRGPHEAVTHSRKRERIWTYHATVAVRRKSLGSPGDGPARVGLSPEDYHATYTFRNERLWSIWYNLGRDHDE